MAENEEPKTEDKQARVDSFLRQLVVDKLAEVKILSEEAAKFERGEQYDPEDVLDTLYRQRAKLNDDIDTIDLINQFLRGKLPYVVSD